MSGRVITFGTIAAVAGLIAANGQQVLEFARTLPDIVDRYMVGLPLGWLSLLIAYAVAVLVWYHADRTFSVGKGGVHGRDLRADLLSFVVGFAAIVAQVMAVGDLAPGPRVTAYMLGILIGLLASPTGRFLLASRRNATPAKPLPPPAASALRSRGEGDGA